ncbi:MAG TPA: sulfatase-like hydrolase/transferase, partial [Tepiditoga sp.]|nr:sulfatase-like hydrolase/transferase [Tepiditoga sp.]
LEAWRRIYYAQTTSTDWNIGRLLTRLQELGLDDNTLVVFTSDHGEMFGAHGRRAKNIFYDEACRVPMVMRLPGQIPAGTRSDACLATPDIMPTLLGLLDLPVPEAAEGLDLSGYARGGGRGAHDAALLQNTGACAAWQDGHEWRALRGSRYTYARY